MQKKKKCKKKIYNLICIHPRWECQWDYTAWVYLLALRQRWHHIPIKMSNFDKLNFIHMHVSSFIQLNWCFFFYLHCDLRVEGGRGGHADVLFIVKLFKLQESNETVIVWLRVNVENSLENVYIWWIKRFSVSLPGQKAVLLIISYKHLSKLAQHTLPSPTQGLCIYWHRTHTHTHSAFSTRPLIKGNYVEYGSLVIFNFLILVLLR